MSIAFALTVFTGSVVYISKINNSESPIDQLTSDPSTNRLVASPDGETVVYIRSFKFENQDAQTEIGISKNGEETSLFQTSPGNKIEDLMFSLDGKKVAFTNKHGNTSTIWIADLETMDLASTPDSWSSEFDSNIICWLDNSTLLIKSSDSNGDVEIHKIDTDGNILLNK